MKGVAVVLLSCVLVVLLGLIWLITLKPQFKGHTPAKATTEQLGPFKLTALHYDPSLVANWPQRSMVPGHVYVGAGHPEAGKKFYLGFDSAQLSEDEIKLEELPIPPKVGMISHHQERADKPRMYVFPAKQEAQRFQFASLPEYKDSPGIILGKSVRVEGQSVAFDDKDGPGSEDYYPAFGGRGDLALVTPGSASGLRRLVVLDKDGLKKNQVLGKVRGIGEGYRNGRLTLFVLEEGGKLSAYDSASQDLEKLANYDALGTALEKALRQDDTGDLYVAEGFVVCMTHEPYPEFLLIDLKGDTEKLKNSFGESPTPERLLFNLKFKLDEQNETKFRWLYLRRQGLRAKPNQVYFGLSEALPLDEKRVAIFDFGFQRFLTIELASTSPETSN